MFRSDRFLTADIWSGFLLPRYTMQTPRPKIQENMAVVTPTMPQAARFTMMKPTRRVKSCLPVLGVKGKHGIPTIGRKNRHTLKKTVAFFSAYQICQTPLLEGDWSIIIPSLQFDPVPSQPRTPTPTLFSSADSTFTSCASGRSTNLVGNLWLFAGSQLVQDFIQSPQKKT